MEEPQLLEPDVSSDKEDAVQNSDASDVPAEEVAAVTETSGESGAVKFSRPSRK